ASGAGRAGCIAVRTLAPGEGGRHGSATSADDARRIPRNEVRTTIMRLVTFIIALLLLAGSVDPTRGWLIALVVVSGLAAIRWRTWAPFSFDPAIDLRLATLVIAVLLLAGTIDPTRDWLTVPAVISGLALFTP